MSSYDHISLSLKCDDYRPKELHNSHLEKIAIRLNPVIIASN